jgi:uncharacterized protein YceK
MIGGVEFLMRKLLFLLLITLIFCGGCRTITTEDAALISTAAAVGHGNLSEWEQLDPEQRKVAHFNLVKALHQLDFTINKREMPDKYKEMPVVNP